MNLHITKFPRVMVNDGEAEYSKYRINRITYKYRINKITYKYIYIYE